MGAHKCSHLAHKIRELNKKCFSPATTALTRQRVAKSVSSVRTSVTLRPIVGTALANKMEKLWSDPYEAGARLADLEIVRVLKTRMAFGGRVTLPPLCDLPDQKPITSALPLTRKKHARDVDESEYVKVEGRL